LTFSTADAAISRKKILTDHGIREVVFGNNERDILANEEAINREFSVLNNIEDNFPKYVLTLDKYDFSRKAMIHKNLMYFLMQIFYNGTASC